MTTRSRTLRLAAPATVLALAASCLTASSTAVTTAPRDQPAASAKERRPAVVSQRVIGRSVNGHPIRAWQLGDPDSDITAVVFAAHHGNELAGMTVLNTLRDGNPVHGINLWVVPRWNIDGVL